MKTKLLGLISLVLAVLCAWQWRGLRAAKAHVSELERAFQTEAQTRETQERKARALEQQQFRLKEDIAQLSSLVATFRAADAAYASNSVRLTKESADAKLTEPKDSNAEPEGGIFGKSMSAMLSKMMKDPAMKDMMRSQQKAVMALTYAGLAKELNLTPEQNEKLTELILDQHMQAMESAQSLFSKSGDSSATSINTAIGEQQKQSEDKIKALLGEEKFAQYEDYQKTAGERVQLNMFKQQLEDGQTLQDEQFKQLMAAIREEREKNPPAIPQDPKQNPANIDKLFSGDALEKQMQWQEEMNQRVLQRAGQILTPEQLKAYGDFQKQQLSMQKMAMTMARGMFGNRDNTTDGKAGAAPDK